MGHKAKVERGIEKSDRALFANESLRKIGEIIKPEGMKYLGTAAVHVFIKKGIIKDDLFFISQDVTLTNHVRQVVADDALLALTKDVKFQYTGSRETKRSGF